MTKVPIAIIPFHDWRKIQLEGFRTRDAHFIEEFSKEKDRVKIIINRPTTLAEILTKRKIGLIKGKTILKDKGFVLFELSPNLYLVDFISKDIVGQITKGYSWFFEKYGSKQYSTFIEKALAHLKINDNFYLLSQNIFAERLFKKLKAKTKVFDAWDNFNKFNVYRKIKTQIFEGYESFSRTSDFWTTNSSDNLKDFAKEFNPKMIFLISNGVDLERFVYQKKNHRIPDDIESIVRPIVGFGGKISQLIDTELLNNTMLGARGLSFVFVGQILDKTVFEKIEKLPNFYYLGDKHYDEYPDYVRNFDICIIPYVVEKSKKSGANTIKVYEYLATEKKVVGTPSNGLEYLSEHLYIVNNAKEFIEELSDTANNKPKLDLESYSWQQKVNDLLTLFKQHDKN